MSAGTRKDRDGRALDVHRRFLALAPAVSDRLAAAIEATGPRRFPDRGGMPPGRFLARTIVGQQLSTQAARSIWARLERAAVEAGQDIPELFAEDRHDLLRACGVSRNKIRALQQVRAAHLDGRLRGERLRGLDHAALSRELLTLWGVGQWTCDMAALFYCGCQDVWPEQDVTVQNTFRDLIGRRRKPAKWAAHFAPDRSWLALYMWARVDAVPDEPGRGEAPGGQR